jgi:hypothetical protein
MARKPAVIRPSKHLEESLREALLSEIDVALSECDRLASWEQAERRAAVHELRRALKRFRAGASLCRGAVDAVEVRAVQEEVRATAERLSATRDRDVLVETIGAVVDVFPSPGRRSAQAIAVAVLAPDKPTTSSADWHGAAAIIRGQLEGLRARMSSVDLRAVGPDGLADSVARRWRRARKAARVPWNSEHLDALHEVRKQCQRIALQLRLVSRLGPRRRLERIAVGLGRVVADIGTDRDLGLLEGLLVSRRAEFPDPRQVEDMLAEIRRRRSKRLKAARRRAIEVLSLKASGIRSIISRGK